MRVPIHFLTVVVNFNNLQTHPSENIFNNNVMKNGSAKLGKKLEISPIPPEKQEAPATLHRRRGYNTT